MINTKKIEKTIYLSDENIKLFAHILEHPAFNKKKYIYYLGWEDDGKYLKIFRRFKNELDTFGFIDIQRDQSQPPIRIGIGVKIVFPEFFEVCFYYYPLFKKYLTPIKKEWQNVIEELKKICAVKDFSKGGCYLPKNKHYFGS